MDALLLVGVFLAATGFSVKAGAAGYKAVMNNPNITIDDTGDGKEFKIAILLSSMVAQLITSCANTMQFFGLIMLAFHYGILYLVY